MTHFERFTSDHYQAVSHTENQSEQFFLDLKSCIK